MQNRHEAYVCNNLLCESIRLEALSAKMVVKQQISCDVLANKSQTNQFNWCDKFIIGKITIYHKVC